MESVRVFPDCSKDQVPGHWQELSQLGVPSGFSDGQWVQPIIFHLGLFYGIFQNPFCAGEQKPALSWEADGGKFRQGETQRSLAVNCGFCPSLAVAVESTS